MSIVLRASAIALFSSLALSACMGDADDARASAVVGSASASEPAAPRRDYYGRTEIEIPGGDGQVEDYSVDAR